jgi:Holliday junction resolvase RusA-like endonuclease
MTAITLTLPYPPGVNNLYGHVGRRRYATARYKAWQQEAALAVRAQGVRGGIKGRFVISMVLTPPDERWTDLDGRAKAPLDLLVKCGIIEDDRHNRQLIMAWSEAPPSKPGFVSIIIRQAAVSPAVTAVAA